MSVARSIEILYQEGLLNEENKVRVMTYPQARELAYVLSCLQGAGLLTQASFTALFVPNHLALLTPEAFELIWSRMPNFLLTQANFYRLVRAAEQENPMGELQRVRDQIFGVHDVEAGAGFEHAAAFDLEQYMQRELIHPSVSASAEKLLQHYGPGLNFADKIQEIKAYVHSLDNAPEHQAAKRCIERMTKMDYTFTDVSGVSTIQLLALTYAAIHDELKRTGTLNDAKALFIDVLYAIQRGDNDNDDEADAPFCSVRSFYTIMQTFNEIHSDFDIRFTHTYEGVVSQFPGVAGAEAQAYLQLQASPATAEDYLRVKELFECLKADASLELIWDKIKVRVETVLWDEFKDVYADNPDHPQFLALINNGQYLALPDLTALEAVLVASPGYQAYQAEQMRLGSQMHRLWSLRHLSPAEQKSFDSVYGVIIKP